MPKICHSFDTKTPVSQVSKKLSDIQKLGSLLPHVVNVTPVGSGKWLWCIKGTVGPISKTFNLEVLVETKQVADQQQWALAGEGDGIRLNGAVIVSPITPSETRIAVDIDMDTGKGIVAAVINNFLKNSLPNDTRDAETKIRSYVEAKQDDQEK